MDTGYDFLMATRLIKGYSMEDFRRRIRAYLNSPPPLTFKKYDQFPQIPLEFKPEMVSHNFVEILQSRQSGRDFSGQKIAFDRFSTFLGLAAGQLKNLKANETSHRRTFPSAGGIYPLEIYIYSRKLDHLKPNSVYHFNVDDNQLEELIPSERDLKLLLDNIQDSEATKNCSAAILITANFGKVTKKYGQRGWRFAFFEAGILLQNFYLCAAALNLRVCGYGGGYDVNFEKALGIDGVNESYLTSLVIG